MTDEERRQLAQNLRKARPEVLDEIVGEAELFISEQLKAGLAADQRAVNTAVILAALLAAIVGGTATLVSVHKVLPWHLGAVGVLVICLLFALVYALRAARPTSFSYCGNNPANWIPDIDQGRSLHESKAGQAAIYAQGIRLNIKCLDAAHSNLSLALRSAVTAVILFTAVEVVGGLLAVRDGLSVW